MIPFINMKNIKQDRSYKHGFSIVETLVSITIVTLAISGGTSIVQKSLQAAELVKARSEAIGLATEAIEYASNLRSSDMISGVAFNGGLLNAFVNSCGTNGCALGINDTPQVTSYSSCSFLKFDSVNHYYGCSSGNPTIFNRKITASYTAVNSGATPVPLDEVVITSTVSYTVQNMNEQVSLESHLMNQQ